MHLPSPHIVFPTTPPPLLPSCSPRQPHNAVQSRMETPIADAALPPLTAAWEAPEAADAPDTPAAEHEPPRLRAPAPLLLSLPPELAAACLGLLRFDDLCRLACTSLSLREGAEVRGPACCRRRRSESAARLPCPASLCACPTGPVQSSQGRRQPIRCCQPDGLQPRLMAGCPCRTARCGGSSGAASLASPEPCR